MWIHISCSVASCECLSILVIENSFNSVYFIFIPLFNFLKKFTHSKCYQRLCLLPHYTLMWYVFCVLFKSKFLVFIYPTLTKISFVSGMTSLSAIENHVENGKVFRRLSTCVLSQIFILGSWFFALQYSTSGWFLKVL